MDRDKGSGEDAEKTAELIRWKQNYAFHGLLKEAAKHKDQTKEYFLAGLPKVLGISRETILNKVRPLSSKTISKKSFNAFDAQKIISYIEEEVPNAEEKLASEFEEMRIAFGRISAATAFQASVEDEVTIRAASATQNNRKETPADTNNSLEFNTAISHEHSNLLRDMKNAELAEDFFEDSFFPQIVYEGKNYDNLAALIDSKTDNFEIVAAGGIGKTTTLFFLDYYYFNNQEKKILPIYIKLNEYNTTKDSDFLNRKIAMRLLDKNYIENSDISSVQKWLFGQQDSPKLLLLLDGLNEVHDGRKDIITLIKAFISLNNVRIVLTSRSSLSGHSDLPLKRIELNEFSDGQVKKILSKTGIEVPQVKSLSIILRNPLMLSLYRRMGEKDDKISDGLNIASQTRLLEKFFSKEQHIFSDEDFGYKYAVSTKVLLPAIAYTMESELKTFELSNNEINETIQATLFKLKHGEIELTLSELETDSRRELYEDLDDIKEVSWNLLDYLTKSASLLNWETRNTKDYYSFRHQIFRDFFSAKQIRCDIDSDIRCSDIATRKLPRSIANTLSEMLGEDEAFFAWEETQDDTILAETELCQLLKKLKVQEDKEAQAWKQRALANILDMIKEIRKGLFGIAFESLDLSKYYANGIFFSKKKAGGTRVTSSFSQCTIDYNSFIPRGHIQWIYCLHRVGNKLISGGKDGYIKVWNTEEGLCEASLKLSEAEIVNIAGNNTDLCVMCLDTAGLLYKLDLSSMTVLGRLEVPDNVISMHYENEDSVLLVTKVGELFKVRLASGIAEELAYLTCGARGAFFANKGKYIVCYGVTGDITRCKVAPSDMSLAKDVIHAISHSKDTGCIICCSEDGATIIYSRQNEAIVLKPDTHSSFSLNYENKTPRVFRLSDDGKKLLVAYLDNTIYVWDIESKTPSYLHQHDDIINDLIYLDDATCASCSRDFSIRVADVNQGEVLDVLSGNSYWVKRFAYLPDEELLYVPSIDSSIKCYSTRTSRQVDYLEGHFKRVYAVEAVPGTSYIVSASLDSTLSIWDTSTGKCICVSEPVGECLDDVAAVTEELFAAVGSRKGVYLFKLDPSNQALILLDSMCYEDGEYLPTEQYGTAVNSISFLPEMRCIALTYWDGFLKYFRIEDSTLQDFASQLIYFYDSSWPYCIREFKDTKGRLYIYLSTRAGNLWRYDAVSFKSLPELVFSTDKGALYQFVFLDHIIILGSGKGYVIAYDIDSNESKEYKLHDGRVFALVADPPSNRVISYSEDGTLRITSFKGIEIDSEQACIINTQGVLIKDCKFDNCTELSHDANLAKVIEGYL